MPFELNPAHVCCTGLNHLTRQWALYRRCRISYCCEKLCWALSIQEQCECVGSYEARTAALISIPFIRHYKHSCARYNRGSPFHKKYVLTSQFQHFAKLMVKGCIRKVSDSNPGPPRGFDGCHVLTAEECLDRIYKNTVTSRFHSPAVHNSVTDSAIASRDSSHCEGFVRFLCTIWLNPFDLKTIGYCMHRYIWHHSEFLYSAHTAVFMCFVLISEQTAIISLYSINWPVFITETESVYCAVRTGSLYIILRSTHTAVFMCFVYLCVLYGSQNKQRFFSYTALTGRSL